MAGFIDTPRTAADETRHAQTTFLGGPDFSMEASFQSPPNRRNDLVYAMSGMPNTPRVSGRNPLGALRNPPQAKNEFTPLLKSATKNLQKAREGKNSTPSQIPRATEPGSSGGRSSGARGGKLRTPVALKPGYKFDNSPALPEASSMFERVDSTELTGEATPIVPVQSSSAVSTPMAILPGRGANGPLDGGNMLTLREQEAKLEQIDKENFGLKLKIHFLEENLSKTGTEYNQMTIRENADLKVDKLTLQRDLKKYSKHLRTAEMELEQYRLQVQEYARKLKLKHADEAMREEMDGLERLVTERDMELQSLRQELSMTIKANGGNEELQGDLEDIQAELRERGRLLDSKDDEIEALKSQLATGNSDDAAEQLEEKDQQIQDQEEKLDQMGRLLREAKDDLNEKEQKLQSLRKDADIQDYGKDAELEDLRERVQELEGEKRRDVEGFEDKYEHLQQEKDEEILSLKRQHDIAQSDMQADLASLEDRLRLAESHGDNKLQLANEAAHEAKQQLRQLTREKDSEIQTLEDRVQALGDVQTELDECQRELRAQVEEAKHLRSTLDNQDDELIKLRSGLGDREREASSLKEMVDGQSKLERQMEQLRLKFNERERELSNAKQTIDEQQASLEEATKLKTDFNEKERELQQVRQTLEERDNEVEVLKQTVDEPDSQLEVVRQVLSDRNQDLDEVRTNMNARERDVDDLRAALAQRQKELDGARTELSTTKQDLEDEIQVLESSLDRADEEKLELGARIGSLERDIEESHKLQSKIESLEKDARTTEREKKTLQSAIDSLNKDLRVADQERADLRRRHTESQSRLSDMTSARAANRQSSSTVELDRLHDMVRKSNIEVESLQLQLDSKTREFQRSNSEHKQQMQASRHELKKLQARLSAGEDTLMLRSEIMEKEKRHVGELKGLSKQIQFLRARCDREARFRQSLTYQKRWFLMNVEMYNSCNQIDLRLLEDMGVNTHGQRSDFGRQKPSLRAAGLAVIAAIRMRRLRAEWRVSEKLHESLVRKFEQMRRPARKSYGVRN